MSCESIAKPSCEQIINILPDPFVVIDRNYRIMAANAQYRKHYGLNPGEDVVGRFCYEVSHHSETPCSQHGEHCPLEIVFNTAQPTQVMHIHYDQHGREEYVQLQSTPLFDDNGKVLYVGEYIFPVSQKQQDTLLIGRSRPMVRMISLLQRVAPTTTTVLLLGESGTGKECVAKYIHEYSPRSSGSFVIVDCGTLGESLIESELFGHEKGAFTGAAGRKKGLFEAAHGGTLFIDEIAELPLSLQTKLLRVLETGTIRRLGGTEYVNVDVRVLAATHRDLQRMVELGEFRQDLYYRLSAFPVHIPSLRDRPDDIAALAENFLANSEDSDHFVPLAPEVIEALMTYDYPGNVRELRNIVERAGILAYGDDMIRPEHLVFEGIRREDVQQTGAGLTESPAHANRKFLQRRHGRLSDDEVMYALESCDGHRARAAQRLGVSERTLYRYVERMRCS
ncbi:MAG: sigma 54-interacting transcriptional regulator [Thiohalomonadaceae bacterium]